MFLPFGFSIQECFICYIYSQKWPLHVNFNISPCGNWWGHTHFSQGFTPCVGMRFCGNVPKSPRNKNPKRHISYLLENVLLLDPKTLLSPLGRGEKTFSSTLNVKILQMARNESVRLGRHIDIEVSCMILWLEVSKLVPILHYPACFKRAQFWTKTPFVL